MLMVPGYRLRVPNGDVALSALRQCAANPAWHPSHAAGHDDVGCDLDSLLPAAKNLVATNGRYSARAGLNLHHLPVNVPMRFPSFDPVKCPLSSDIIDAARLHRAASVLMDGLAFIERKASRNWFNVLDPKSVGPSAAQQPEAWNMRILTLRGIQSISVVDHQWTLG